MLRAYTEYLERIQTRSLGYLIPPRLRLVSGKDASLPQIISLTSLRDRLGMSSPHTWYIQGQAGTGKTTLLNHLLTELLKNDILAFRIDNLMLRRVAPPTADVLAFARQARPAEIPEALWKSRVKHARLVVLIDGINEIRREFEGSIEWNLILRFLSGGHPLPVVATSRDSLDELAGVDQRTVHHTALAPLRSEDIEHYLVAHGFDPIAALQDIRAAGMEGAAENPFLLSLLVALIRCDPGEESRIPVPHSRAELLQYTISRPVLEHRLTLPEKAAIGEGLDLNAGMCAVGLTLLRASQAEARISDLVALLQLCWRRELALSISTAITHTQLLSIRFPEGYFTLIHDSLLDFALSLGWRKKSLPLVAFNERYFDHFLGDWVGLQASPSEASLRLIPQALEFRRYDLLVDVAIANRGTLNDHARRELWWTIGQGLISDRTARNRLANALSTLSTLLANEAISSGLLWHLQREHPKLADKVVERLRRGTFNAISFQRDRRAILRARADAPRQRVVESVEVLLHRLQTASESKARGAAATALGRIGDRGAVEALSRALSEDAGPDVRGSAATALGRIGDRGAVEALSRALSEDADAVARGSAATALGQIGDRSAVEALSRALLDSNAPHNVRGSAATALGRIADRGAVEALSRALSEDANAVVRGSAATALGQIGDRSAVEALSRALSDSNATHNVRGSAATALGKIGDRSAVEALSRALSEDVDAAVRGSAATALGQIGDRSAVEALSRALSEDAGPDVRGSAATALGQIGDRSAVEALSRALSEDTGPDVRGSAATALGRIADRGAVEALSRALSEDADAVVRGSAATALGQLGDRSAVEALSRALSEDADAVVRGSAATALGQLGDRSAVEALSRALSEDADAITRGSAATALGKIGDRSAVEALSRALSEDTGPDVRGSAATALGQIGDRSAVEALSRTLSEDADAVVRGSAATALALVGDPSVVPILKNVVLSDDDSFIRSCALNAETKLSGAFSLDYIPVADELRGATDQGSRKLRGKFVERCAAYVTRPEHSNWLDRVARFDHDPANRTVALQCLVDLGLASESLLRFLLDPDEPRRDKRRGDTDNGVRGVGTTAVIRMYDSGGTPSARLRQVVADIIADPRTWSSVTSATMHGLKSLNTRDAKRALTALEEDLAGREISERSRHQIDQTRRVHEIGERMDREFQMILAQPQRVLAAFERHDFASPRNSTYLANHVEEPVMSIHSTDVFICHASEDKEAIARRLYDQFTGEGISCWLDEVEIKWGDSIPQKISEGLASSRYVIVILTPDFLKKPWPQREMYAALYKEASSGTKVILPLLSGSREEQKQVLEKFFLTNDKRYLEWDGDPSSIIQEFKRML